MSADDRLDRFVTAQEPVIDAVRAELARGEKRSHWMWFVFPQIAGLGRSATARHYAIESLAEARAYLAHPVLGERLRECTRLMLQWAGRRSADAVLGGIDAMKLHSCLTLFERVGEGDDTALFASAIDAFYAGERDTGTLRILES